MKTVITFILMASMAFSFNAPNFHDFKIQALDSDEIIELAGFKGKKILVVNVASKCGFTPQYKDLQALYEKYQDKLVIIGFPCNQFGSQEPGTETLIQEFCSANYGVTFPMTTKVDVKGDDQHPIYQWLTSKTKNGKDDYKVSWNFNKFLIDEEGNLIDYFPSKVKPFDEEIVSHLK
ncbi:MAG: glutathione peroxidase [Cyclobacteriaceae bacterium]|nr:glutathione peroxidase [Cyclobacteriaceae bacterium]